MLTRTLLLSVLLLCSLGAMAQEQELVRTSRYTEVNNWPTPSQLDIFSATIHMSFSRDIYSVGDAIDLVLLNTGYVVASSFSSDPFQELALGKPLPEAHRSIGPMPLYKALETLIGDEYFLVTDNVHALVAFDLRPEQIERYGSVTKVAQHTPFQNQARARARQKWVIGSGQPFVEAIDVWANEVEWKAYWPDGQPDSVLATSYQVEGDFYSAVNTALQHLSLHGLHYSPSFFEDSKTVILKLEL